MSSKMGVTYMDPSVISSSSYNILNIIVILSFLWRDPKKL